MLDERIQVTRASMPPYEEFIEAIKPLWDTHWITNMGTYHRELETRLRDYLDVPEISLTVNGHLALELAIQAFEFPENSEVITTPFTFVSTTHAIARNRLKPVFCDIKPDTYTIDVEKIENLITDNTVAIVPVHVYGNICDVEAIDKIAKKHHLKVIYDAAHAFGETYQGHGIGSYGDASMFSFHATKVFNSIEGGAVCYKNEEYGRRLYNLKNFGIRGLEIVESIGANAKMNEFQAIMGLCNLNHIDTYISQRKIVFEVYDSLLKEVEGIQIPRDIPELKRNYGYYPVLIRKEKYGIGRNELYEFLKQNGIFTRKYFYPITNEFECYKLYKGRGDTPVAHEIAESILTLPIFSDMNERDAKRICKLIACSKKN